MALVAPSDPLQLFDIDCMVALANKQVVGFIFEPIGPVTMPLYSV